MCIQIKAKKKAKRENKDGGKTKIGNSGLSGVENEKSLEPFCGNFTMVGIPALIQIMMKQMERLRTFFLFHCRHF